jgi:hypothetical protein
MKVLTLWHDVYTEDAVLIMRGMGNTSRPHLRMGNESIAILGVAPTGSEKTLLSLASREFVLIDTLDWMVFQRSVGRALICPTCGGTQVHEDAIGRIGCNCGYTQA